MDGWRIQGGRANVLGRSVVVSLAVFVVELTGVAAADALGVASAIAFAAVQLVGTCLTFSANKYWAFDAAKTGRGPREVARSAAVFAGSFALNIALPSAGTYFLPELSDEPVVGVRQGGNFMLKLLVSHSHGASSTPSSAESRCTSSSSSRTRSAVAHAARALGCSFA